MPHCPKCRFEYTEGVTHCADCGRKLAPGRLPAELDASDRARPVRLCTVPDASAGDILHAILLEHGIPSVVQRSGPITGELGRVTDGLTEDYAILLVPANRLEEAQRVLAELETSPVEWPEGMEPED